MPKQLEEDDLEFEGDEPFPGKKERDEDEDEELFSEKEKFDDIDDEEL